MEHYEVITSEDLGIWLNERGLKFLGSTLAYDSIVDKHGKVYASGIDRQEEYENGFIEDIITEVRMRL